ncbi:MAG: hypothetical protein AABZ73_04970, partial [Pseudomonadota bacterium]
GVEQKFWSIGKTTVYGEYGQFDLDDLSSDSLAPTIWGFGVVQEIDQAAIFAPIYLRAHQPADPAGPLL